MESFLNGTVTRASGPSNPHDISGTFQMQKFFNRGNVSFEHINRTFADIADSVTTYIRQNAKLSNVGSRLLRTAVIAPATGRAFRVDTCISVRWVYIAVPTTLSLLTLVFFVAMLIETTRQHKCHGWKSSSLAMLFHGLDPETKGAQGETETVGEMETVANQVQVRFRKMERGWGLSQTNWDG